MAAPPTDSEGELLRTQLSLRSSESEAYELKGELADALEARGRAEKLRQHSVEEFEAYVAFSKRELSGKEQELRELRSSLEALQKKYKVDTDELISCGVAERTSLEAQALNREGELKALLREALLSVEKGSQFMEERADLLSTVEKLQERLESEGTRFAVTSMEAERNFILEKLELERRLVQQREDMGRVAKQEANQELSSSQRRVFRENDRLNAEVGALSVETRKLVHALEETGSAREHLSREVANFQGVEKLWAERCAKQTKRVKELEARVRELEEVSAGADEFRKKEEKSLRERFARESEGMRVELSALRSLLGEKNKELRTVKRLGSLVLGQRTEVEQFFLDALAEVKMEALERKKSEKAAAAAAESAATASALKKLLSPPPLTGAISKLKITSPRSTLLPQPVKTPVGTPRAPPTPVTTINTLKPKGSHVPEALLNPITLAAAAAAAGGDDEHSQVVKPHPKGVDLYDLNIEDRALVLRKLFARMNRCNETLTGKTEKIQQLWPPEEEEEEEEGKSEKKKGDGPVESKSEVAGVKVSDNIQGTDAEGKLSRPIGLPISPGLFSH